MNENSSKNKYVPKLKTDVKILTDDTQIVNDYTIFLRLKEDSQITESLREFLQCEDRLFLPLIYKNNIDFVLMNIHNIIYIIDSQKSLNKAGKTITLTLTNKTRLKVKLLSNSLDDRVSDFINSKNNFLEFITEAGFNIYISKYKISTVKEKAVY